MAGIGSAWGSREEMLHPRDRHGRFRKKWKMAASVVDALSSFLDRFQPHSFQSDQQAAQYAFNNRKVPWSDPELRRLHTDWDDANESLQAGQMDDTTKKFVDMMDRNMVETTDDLIVSQTVPTEAFGLSAQQAQLEDGGLEDLIGLEIADAGYSAANLGSELSHPPGSVTLRVAVPKGTKVAYGGRSPNDRGLIFDRDQPLVVTKVEPDGRGGWYMLAIAGSGARTKGATAVADDRTHGRRGSGLTPDQREARVTPQMSGEKRFQAAEKERQANEAATLAHQKQVAPELVSPQPGTPAQTPAPAAPASPQAPAPPATGVPERREPVHAESIGPGSPAGKSASEIATDAEAAKVQAENAPPTPAAPPSPADFRAATAGIPSPAAGRRRAQWNKAHQGVVTGKRDPRDVLRELDTDIAIAKQDKARIARGEDSADPNLDSDIESMDQLADAISQHSGTPRRGRGREAEKTGDGTSPTPTPATSEPATPAKKVAKKAGPTPTPGAPSTKTEGTPKAAAPKKAAKRPAADIAGDVKKAGTREEAAGHLENLTGPELREVAGELGTPLGSRATKDQMKKAIVQHGVGRRLDSDAISGNGRRMRGDNTTDNERRLIEAAKKYRGKERNSEEKRIVDEADKILERQGVEKRISGQETRSEMRKRTEGPGLSDEQKADIKAKAQRADDRVQKELDADAAATKAELTPLLEAAGLQEDDLDDLDKTGAALILGGIRDKKMSKAEGVRRLKASKSPRLKALGDALGAQPRKTAVKKAAAKAVPEAPAAPVKAVAKKAVPAKAAPSPVDAEEEAFKQRVKDAGLPDKVADLRARAKAEKIRGFSTMNKKQLQQVLMGEEVNTSNKIGVVPPAKMVPHLEAADSDTAARALLQNHTLNDLKALAKERGVKLPSQGATKPKVMDMVLADIRGNEGGISGRTPDTSLKEDLGQLGYIDLPGGNGDKIKQEISQVDANDPESLRTGRDNLEKASKQFRGDGDKNAANMAQAAADAMGMRAQTISGVEEGAPPVKRVAKKAAPDVGDLEPEAPKTLDKMLKPELEALAAKEGVPGVRKSMTKAQLKEAIEKNRRMDSSRGAETADERQRRELGALPGGAERLQGPAQGPLHLPDRAPTPEEIARDNPATPAAKVAKARALKRVPEGSVAGPKAAEPIATPGRRDSFTEAWDSQGFADDPSMAEIRDDIASGKITHEEGIRRLDSEVTFHEEEMSDLASELEGMAPEDRDQESGVADGIHARRAELSDAITNNKKAIKFLRGYAKDEAPVTQEDLDAKLKGPDKAALERTDVDSLKEAARQEGLGEIEGDDKDTVVQNIARKMAVRELANREKEQNARDQQAVADRMRTHAEAIAGIEDALNGGSDRALAARIKSQSRHSRLGPELGRELQDAAGDRDAVRKILARVASEQGLRRSHKRGEKTHFDPEFHDLPPGSDIKKGDPVTVLAPGFRGDPKGVDMQIHKAKVTEGHGGVPEAPTTPKKAAKFLPPLKDGTQRKSFTNVEVGDVVQRAGARQGPAKRVTKIDRGPGGIVLTFEDGTTAHGHTNTAAWMGREDDTASGIRRLAEGGFNEPLIEGAPPRKAAKAAVPAKAAPKAVDLDNPTRHNAELIGTGLDLDPKGEDRQWLDVVQRDLDQGTDGRQIADGLRREADSQRTLHNIQESVGGTEGASPAARINRMELMADRLEGVRPIQKATPGPAKGAPETGAPGKRDMDTMQAASAQSDALRDLRNGKSHAEVATALRARATSVGSKEHDPQTVRPLEFTPSERSAMKRGDAKKLRELAAEIQAQGVAQRAAAKATKKAAPAKKAGTNPNLDALSDEDLTKIRESEKFRPDQKETIRQEQAARAVKAAAPKKHTAAEMRRARSASESEGVPVEQILERWDGQKEDRKNLTGPVGEMVAGMIDDAVQRATAAPDELRASHELQTLPHSEMRTLADRMGVPRSGTKAQLGQRIAARMRGTETPTTSAERAIPKAPTKKAAPRADLSAEAAKATADVLSNPENISPPRPGPSGGTTTQPPKPHDWGNLRGQQGSGHYYHKDGQIPMAMDRLGDDAQLDVGGGESLYNAMGDIATDMVMGRISGDTGVARLRALATKLPAGSEARRRVAALADGLDRPAVPMPKLPDDTPAPVRRLVQDMISQPLARATGRFGSSTFETSLIDKVKKFLDEKASGNSSLVGMGQDLATLIHNHSHESQEGSMGLGRLSQPLHDQNSEITKALQAWAKEIRARRSS